MANSPAAAPNGQFRVVRIDKFITEAYVTAVDAPSAKEAARALGNEGWQRRKPLQTASTDHFEYDVVAPTSDDGA